ncbi:MAG TPA: pantoate kinase [Halococcus sp.]|nr:pantoate kinase [Halococcus sp.]
MTTAGRRDEHDAQHPVQAFVPGHVTGFFSVHPHDDPRQAGSRGAGLSLSDGVTVELHPADETAVELDGDTVEFDAVTHTLSALGVTARVVIETPLPVSAGFGVSGGAALGTALAANARFELAHTENELVGIAHAAEVEAGTGLGDVVAQARGGVSLRVEPGAPGYGVGDGIPVPPTPIEYVSFGGRSTKEIIGGDVETLSQAGERALSELLKSPTLSRMMALSREFAHEADLLTPPVNTAIETVEETGGEAAMAMLGETVFALEGGLTDAGYDPEICEIDPTGARLV